MGSMDEKVVLVTGATGALGTSVCEAFLEQGAKVHGTYVHEHERAAFEARVGPGCVTLHALDVTDAHAVARLFETLEAKVHVLAHVAGGFAMGAIEDTEPATFDAQLALNLKSAFLFARHAVKCMKPAGFGRIVFVASKSALDAPGKQTAYVASKAGLLGLAKSLAAELKGTGITVASVVPSVMDTPGNRASMPKADFTKWVPTASVARVMVFLAGDAASITSGAVVPVYGDS